MCYALHYARCHTVLQLRTSSGKRGQAAVAHYMLGDEVMTSAAPRGETNKLPQVCSLRLGRLDWHVAANLWFAGAQAMTQGLHNQEALHDQKTDPTICYQ